MKMYVDGGCRRNGQPDAIGAAAAVNKLKWGRQKAWSQILPRWPIPTNQRAEITAIILALSNALERYGNLIMNPRLRLTVYSDSEYAVNCMSQWVHKWSQNGWTTVAGSEVANQDLIRYALVLESELKEKGSVKYIHIPRANNQEADTLCNRAMNELE